MHVVIGAGMGGLAAAIALANAGREVTVIEARDRVGGLAGGVPLDGRTYDGGPYILLDRPGLEWVFEILKVDLAPLTFLPLDEPWRVHRPDGPSISIYGDLQRTSDAMERAFPGSAKRYEAFVRRMTEVYDKLVPLQRGEPGILPLLRAGAFRHAPFLLQGLERHLDRTGLPAPIRDALGIWTHIAGQPLSEAPAPLALVPASVHSRGAWTVEGGIHKIPERLAEHARSLGVTFRMGQRVSRIVRNGRQILGVEVDGERIVADAVVSGAAGVGTYVELLDPPDPSLSKRLTALPLQSPGVAAYLHTEQATAPFLQFFLPPGELCRVLIHPGAVDPTRAHHARLLSPTKHDWAAAVGEEGQQAHLDALLAEDWWHADVPDATVLARRVPSDWGRRYHLYRDSMNPVMTAQFMRRGRLPHQSPIADNLFLAGSSTHPGQWVSFCAISGILAAKAAVAR
jgi:phytoene dehydrogenase-like protein